MQRITRERPELVAEVLGQVRDRGPIAASELTAERPRRSGPWWDWSDAKRALEWLFWSGQVTAARRRSFERLYDLPERVLPAAVLAAPTPDPAEAQRELVRDRRAALGVAAERDLRDYFRLPAAESKRAGRRAGRGGRAAPGRGRGLGRDRRLPRPGRADPAPGRGDAR